MGDETDEFKREFCGAEVSSSLDSLIIVSLRPETKAIVILKSSSDAASRAEVTGDSGFVRTESAIFCSCSSTVRI